MKNIQITGLTFCLFLSLVSFSQTERNVMKAENNIERGNLKAAKEDYLEALAKDSNSRPANLGLGLMYSELLDNYAEALPYLEKAYDPAARDTSYDLIFALAKCYHYKENFEKAMSFYNRLKGVQDLEKEIDFQRDINKRKQDCEFAMSKINVDPDKNIYIVNAGKAINTEMPEYVPVISGKNELIFTSKRKDNKDEELNYIDGKYFESMYIANIVPNGFTGIRRYTLPDKLMSSKFYNHHQAVVSISQDGKKLFTFKDSKLFEISLDERNYNEPGEVKIKKFNHYQNHAFLSKDGNTLYFTSDVDGGSGGTDIYKSVKGNNGEWGPPQNLGEPINTAFDEDAPYLDNKGTFYFASEGHEGFGNYDIYKSNFTDGHWSAPENMGKPINSPGHDIFLVMDSVESSGYFSSGRNGGFGDMDIYKIVYLDKIKKDCPSTPFSPLAVNIAGTETGDYKKKIEINTGNHYKILSAEWKINGSPVAGNSTTLNHDFQKPGNHTVDLKYLAWCDTCLNPVITCTSISTILADRQPAVAANTASIEAEEKKAVASATTVSKKDEEMKETKVKEGEGIAKDNDREKDLDADKDKAEEKKKTKTKVDKKASATELSTDQLAAIGFNSNHILFDFNKTTLRSDAIEILNTNIGVMKKHPELYLQVNGFTDSRGPKEINERISESRAKTVKDYLIKNGTRSSQIKFTSGKGSEKLLNNCGPGVECDEAAHQLNRRVEFVVTGQVKE